MTVEESNPVSKYLFLPGALNPLAHNNRTPFARADVITDDSLAVYRRAIGSVIKPNLFNGVTKFQGVVLFGYPVDVDMNSPRVRRMHAGQVDGQIWETFRSNLVWEINN